MDLFVTPMFGIIFLIWIGTIIFGIGQAVWIYKDSKKRKDNLALVWGIVSLIAMFTQVFLPLPIIIYLIITRGIYKNCPNCGVSIKKEFNSCPECGYEIKKRCSNCNSWVEDDWRFCPNCKNQIK